MCNFNLYYCCICNYRKDGDLVEYLENMRFNPKESIICLENVCFSYKADTKPIINNLNLNIKSGEFIVLAGQSGCGKTTITRIINGLAMKFYEGILEGNVKILGKDIQEYKLWEIGKFIGTVFQDPKSQFFASITEDEIAFGCENYGINREELQRRVSDSIDKINGNNLIGKEIYPMSSGEKQKIAIASINAVNPLIYVFDEPSANLDMYSVESLKILMKSLKDSGHTVIVSEHRMYYLTDLADKFIYLQDGQIKKEMTSDEFCMISDDERCSMGIRNQNLSNVKLNNLKLSLNKRETLTVKNLKFDYKGREIFNNVSFKAYEGDIIAICGHNGIGKTTLSRILSGIKKEKSGEILYNGRRVSYRKRRNFVYFVMQNTDCSIFSDSLEEELLLNNKKLNKVYISEILSRYNLARFKEKHPALLSGGQKQRLSLAVSDIIDRDVLILDEPTSGLDYRNMIDISNHLKELASKGKTILIITHDYEFALNTCNRVLHFISADEFELFNMEEKLCEFYNCLMEK